MSEALGDSSWRSVRGAWSYLVAVGSDYAATSLILVALGWLASRSSSSVWPVALVLGLETVPRVILMLWGGAVADRLGVWRAARATLVLRVAVLVGACGVVLLLTGSSRIVGLAVVAVLLGVVDAVHEPAIDAASGLMAAGEVQQGSLTGAMSATRNAAEIVAGPLAGGLLAIWAGLPTVLAAVLVVVAAVAFWICSAARSFEPLESEEGVWKDAVAGIAVARGLPGVVPILVLVILANAITVAPLFAGVPLMAREYHWSGLAFGVVSAGFAVGGLLGAVCVSAWGAGLPRPTLAAVWALLPAALALGALALARSAGVAFVAVVLFGGFATFCSTLLWSQLKHRTPDAYLGRVMGMTGVAVYAGIPLGYGVYAGLAQWTSIRVAGLAMAAAFAAWTVFCLSRRSTWAPASIDAEPLAQSPAEAP